MTAIRIVIADDHPIFRAGLQGLLSAQEDFEVVGEAANGREAVAVVRHAAPNVLLVDLQMPELDGLGAIREIRAVAPATPPGRSALAIVRIDGPDAFSLLAALSNSSPPPIRTAALTHLTDIDECIAVRYEA